MRGTVVSAVLLALVIILMATAQAALFKESESTAELIKMLRNAAETEKWDEAQDLMEEITEKWESSQIWVSMLIDHEEVDSVATTLAALSQYVKYQETPELMAELETFRHLIEHIPRRESPALQNIL